MKQQNSSMNISKARDLPHLHIWHNSSDFIRYLEETESKRLY